ncbi:TAP transporter inhibitor ICP47 [Macacine alphaherpesvirus 1]|uniref:TAP transporter inhibitor ICP47 n=1 Tax=Cercopithecine herpesvirus 1 TaxID=10325 RepID=A0A059WJ97_CHV1|nr:TAP transporter inhibitor ICP47 [Macacine alphaherpesvirus 1]
MSSRYLAAVDDYLQHPSPRYQAYVDLRRELCAYADAEHQEATKAIPHPERPLLPPPSTPSGPTQISAREAAHPSAPTTASS